MTEGNRKEKNHAVAGASAWWFVFNVVTRLVDECAEAEDSQDADDADRSNRQYLKIGLYCIACFAEVFEEHDNFFHGIPLVYGVTKPNKMSDFSI